MSWRPKATGPSNCRRERPSTDTVSRLRLRENGRGAKGNPCRAGRSGRGTQMSQIALLSELIDSDERNFWGAESETSATFMAAAAGRVDPVHTVMARVSALRTPAMTSDIDGDDRTTQPELRPSGLLVLGMHRSGTSLVTDLLQTLGLYVGDPDHLTPANWENPRGFFERRDMRAICDRLLHAAGSDWWKVGAFAPDAVLPELAARTAAEFRGIRAELERHGQWAVKEPRLCLVLPLLSSGLRNCAALIVVRNPVEVARSLRTRNGFPTAIGLALWELYTSAALRNSAALPRRVVLHHEVVGRPAAAVAALREDLIALGLAVGAAEQTSGVVDTALHRARAEEGEEAALLSPQQRAMWDAICRGSIDEVALDVSPLARRILSDFDVDEAARLDQASLLSQRGKELRSAEEKLRGLERCKVELKERDEILRLRAAEIGQFEILLMKSRAQEIAATDDAVRLRQELEAIGAKVREHEARADADRRQAAERAEARERRMSALSAENAARQARVTTLRERLSARSDTMEAVYFRRRRQLGRGLRVRFAEARYWLWDRHLVRLLPKKLRRRIEVAAVSRAPLFAAKWYARECMPQRADGSSPRKTPAEHFVTVGWRKGLQAGPYFDTKWYLEQHPELAVRGLNPLLHFVKVGALTGQRPNPKVDVAGYLERNPGAVLRSVTMVDIVTSRIGKSAKKQRSAEGAVQKPPG